MGNYVITILRKRGMLNSGKVGRKLRKAVYYVREKNNDS